MDAQYQLFRMLSADFEFLERQTSGCAIVMFNDLKTMVFGLRIFCKTCDRAVALGLFDRHWLERHHDHPLEESDDESEHEVTAVADITAQYYMVDNLFKAFSFVKGHMNASSIGRLDVVKDILSGLKIVCDECSHAISLGLYKNHWSQFHDDGDTLGTTDSETDDECLLADMEVSQGESSDPTGSLVPSADSSQYMDVSQGEGTDPTESLVPSADSSQFMDVSQLEGSDPTESLVPSADSSHLMGLIEEEGYEPTDSDQPAAESVGENFMEEVDQIPDNQNLYRSTKKLPLDLN